MSNISAVFKVSTGAPADHRRMPSLFYLGTFALVTARHVRSECDASLPLVPRPRSSLSV